LVSLNPPTQYASDANLRARQRLWDHQRPPFDLVSWALDLAGLHAGSAARVLDVGCGNGRYLAALRGRDIDAVGCDLSPGMLDTARSTGAPLLNGDMTDLPLASATFDVVLAPHVLYHVADRLAAAQELRRVLRPAGRCLVITNGTDHMRSLRSLVESAVRVATPGWEMRNPSTHVFSLENGGRQLRRAFDDVAVVPAIAAAPVVLIDAAIAADYVASVADHYQHGTERPWREVVEDVRRAVQRVIDEDGSFVVRGESGAFVCT
jgi:SAM-dependent methyltransferase